MEVKDTEVAHLQECLESCQIELDTLVRDREWYVTDVLDLIESSLEIIKTIKDRDAKTTKTKNQVLGP